MATALQCDICGGKLVGKPGGVFECDSCGMEYSTEWAKIQEIKGTVKVEGTVEVTGKVQVEGGTVQVEGTANKESLLKRGQLALEDGKWAEADSYFDKVLDIDPECAEAYLGKLMAELQVKKQADLKNCDQPFNGNKIFQKVLRFGGSNLAEQVKAANESIVARNQAKAERRNAKKTNWNLCVNGFPPQQTLSALDNTTP